MAVRALIYNFDSQEHTKFQFMNLVMPQNYDSLFIDSRFMASVVT